MNALSANTEGAYARGRNGDEPLRPPAEDFGLRALLLLLLRRRWQIAVPVFILSVVAFLVIKQLPSYYTAGALVMVQPTQASQSPIGVNPQSGELDLSPDRLESEVQVVTSPELIERAVAKLELIKDPEFNAALRPRGPLRDVLPVARLLPDLWVSALERALPKFLVDWLSPSPSLVQLPMPEIDPAMLAVVNAFSNRLQVAQVGRSRVLKISFESLDPVKAATIANAIVDLYLVSALDANLDAAVRTNAWLSAQVADLRKQVSKADARLEDYRAKSGLLETRDVTLVAQQVAEMSTELSRVRAERAQVESRLKALERAAASPDNLDKIADARGLDQLRSLRDMEAMALQQLAALSKELGPRHPNYVAAEAELLQLREQIAAEQARVLAAARGDATAARLREASLTVEIEQLKGELAQANEAAIQLAELRREADASRTLLETFLVRSKERELAQSFEQPSATVLATARPPLRPSHPNKSMLMALSVIVFAIGSVTVAFLAETFDRGFRSGEQVERMTGFTSLGLVPAVTGRRRPQSQMLRLPSSGYVQAIHSLYAAVILPRRSSPPKLIQITSSLPKEGKTTLALSLGRAIALSGKSVLVVDCDLHHPSVHRNLGASAEPGLVDFLFKRVPLERVIQQDHASPMQFIAAGTPLDNAAMLLGSDTMRAGLEQLRIMFDLVLLDSPPALAVADPRALGTLADTTIFVTRWGYGDRRAVIDALNRLEVSGVAVAGVALTRVDMKRHARYGYADSSYFSRAVRQYYI